VDNALTGWGSDRKCFPAEVRAAYIAALRDPATAHAICEEYRAAATLDFAQDMDDRRVGRRIACTTPRVDRSITGMWMQAGRSVSGVIGPTT
jgi:hypothetical protein